MNPEDGTPIAADPVAPVDNNPAPEVPSGGENDPAPAPAPAGGESNDPTVPKGTSPQDIDVDALLDQLEAEANEEQSNPTPEPGAEEPKPGDDVEEPKPNEEPKPEDENKPLDITEPIDVAQPDNYFNTPEIPEYGIKPVGELRDPQPGESANDYYKTVTMPAILQTVQNMVGFSARNQEFEQSKTQQQEQEAFTQRMDGWGKEIESLSGRGIIKGIEKDADGAIDPKSEGGKVVGDVLKFINEHNESKDGAKNPINSFSQGYVQWKSDQDAKAADEAKSNANANRRSKAHVLNGGRSGGRNSAPKQIVQKGQRATDIDFESIL